MKPTERRGNPNLATQNKEAKPQLRPGSQVCQCAYCDLYFTGIKPFDRHLKGKGTGDVSCRTVKEMEAIGMNTNSNGVWMYGLPLKAKA